MSAIRAVAMGAFASLTASAAHAEPIYAYKVASNRLVGFDSARPAVVTSDLPIFGLVAGETLAGIDFRPQNGLLYGLGVNATADTATLYCLSIRTGFAAPVGTASGITLADAGSVTIDLPDPATQSYGIDFNPAVDRVRVTTGSGLNFRINPNNGVLVDTNGGVLGAQPDSNINGSGVTGVAATAYTNNQPNNNVTTQYTLDDASNALYIQNPPNTGAQTLGQSISLSGSLLDFTAKRDNDRHAGRRFWLRRAHRGRRQHALRYRSDDGTGAAHRRSASGLVWPGRDPRAGFGFCGRLRVNRGNAFSISGAVPLRADPVAAPAGRSRCAVPHSLFAGWRSGVPALRCADRTRFSNRGSPRRPGPRSRSC